MSDIIQERIKRSFDTKLLCPKCGKEYMNAIVVHTYNIDALFNSCDMKCPRCGYTTYVMER